MHTLLPGYHVTSIEADQPGLVERFLTAVSRLHREMETPFTLFVQGRTLGELSLIHI